MNPPRAVRTKLEYCFRTAYANERAANAHINKIRRGRARSKGTNSARVYEASGPCPICNLYHVTSHNGKG